MSICDAITFRRRSVQELKQVLAASVEDHVDFCKERGEAPEKPVQGNS